MRWIASIAGLLVLSLCADIYLGNHGLAVVLAVAAGLVAGACIARVLGSETDDRW